MARNNRSNVKDIIDTDLTDSQIDAFLSDANTWVTDFLGSEGLSTGRLTIIEKYLTAHYITLRDPRVRRGAIDDVDETYQRDPQVTEYLMQAIAEDPTGIVRSKLLDQENQVALRWRTGTIANDS